MYPVTEAYKQQMEKVVRNYSHIKIVFGITDPDAPNSSTITDNGHEVFNDSDSVDKGVAAATPYATLEHNRMTLDGRSLLPPDDDFVYQGFVSSFISDENGVWERSPKLTIEFNQVFQFAGLSFNFDTQNNDYPSELQLDFYKGGVQLASNIIYPDKADYESSEHIPLIDKMVLTFLKSSRPYRRARISTLIYGLVSTLTEQDITECSYKTSADVVSSALPNETFSFTIFDTEQKYDPENPKGVWEYLESRQPVQVSIGYSLDEGYIEWMPLCNTYSTGNVKVSRGGVVTECTFETTSLLQQLEKEYTEGVYTAEGATLYDLAEKVMAFCGYPDIIELDDSLRSIRTTAPLAVQPCNQILQLIANAGMCVFVMRRSGIPAMIKLPEVSEDFHFDGTKIFDRPVTSKYPVLRDLKTTYSIYTVESEETDLIKNASVSQMAHTEIVYSYSNSVNQRVVAGSGVTVESSKFYVNRAVLVVSGTGTISLRGYLVTETKVDVTKVVHEVGDTLEMSNSFITSEEHAQQYADWIAREMERRIEYTAEDRGYPELDVGDLIKFTTNFGNVVDTTVLTKEIKFNGAIRGSGVYLVKEATEDVENTNIR